LDYFQQVFCGKRDDCLLSSYYTYNKTVYLHHYKKLAEGSGPVNTGAWRRGRKVAPVCALGCKKNHIIKGQSRQRFRRRLFSCL
jgi:hypothetical protein